MWCLTSPANLSEFFFFFGGGFFSFTGHVPRQPLELCRIAPILADLVAGHPVVAISSVDSEMLFSAVPLEVESSAVTAGEAQPHREMQ